MLANVGPLDPDVCQQSLRSQTAERIYKQASSPQTFCLENRSHRNANTAIPSLLWARPSKQDSLGTLRRKCAGAASKQPDESKRGALCGVLESD